MIRNFFIAIAVCAVMTHLQLSSSLEIRRLERPSGSSFRDAGSSTCGVAKIHSGLIVNGQSFKRGTFPWIVALIYTGRNTEIFFCGGTLVSKLFVLTGMLGDNPCSKALETYFSF